MLASRVGRIAVTLAVLFAFALGPAPALAAPGELDPGFGPGGKVTTVFPGGSYANAVAIARDGRIVAAGAAAGPSMQGVVAVARYLPDGTLDPAFSGDGMRITDVSGGGDEGRSVAVQPDGRIVVAGTAGGRFVALRYRANGSLDPTFGGDGIVRTNLTKHDDVAYDLAIQPDGRILLAGTSGMPVKDRFALVRYRADGTLDPTFGDGGRVIARGGVARAVALQSDGRIVLTGYNGYGTVVDRYRRDGRYDPTFGGDGRVGHVVGPVFPLAVAVQANGKIVVGGDHDIFRIGLARFTRDGRLDSTFGGDGVVSTHVGPGEQAVTALAIQRSGRIVAVGHAGPHEFGDTTPWRFVATRYLRDGSLDPSWGGDGRVATYFAGGASAEGAALQADGKVVAAGGAGASNAGSFALVRYRGGSGA